VAAGALRRLRPGWYATPTADADVARAVAAGGVASCITALSALGVWAPSDHRVHVRRTRRLRAKQLAGLVACDVPHARTTPADRAVDGVLDALSAAAGCLTSEMLTVVIDSALHQGLTTRDALDELWLHAPRRVRRALAAADRRAESGTETLVRVRMAARGIHLSPQVSIGDKRVDLLLGRLIIEVDSKAWHLDEEAYERDRARDRQLAALGYHVVRLTYAQVMHGWAAVEADLLTMIGRGVHLTAREGGKG
jgi:very-short-patch-repair endonuclease